MEIYQLQNTALFKNNIWMWSGAHGSTHDYSARGPGFDPTPKPRMAFSEALISLLSDNRLKNDFIHL
jgi:hypothetical protein